VSIGVFLALKISKHSVKVDYNKVLVLKPLSSTEKHALSKGAFRALLWSARTKEFLVLSFVEREELPFGIFFVLYLQMFSNYKT